MKFFTSDTHQNHKNILKYSKRPFATVEEMNEALIKNHNRTVSPKDEVYFLGDFSFSRTLEPTRTFLEQLNGIKYFIHGNHDVDILKNKSYFIGENLFRSIESYKEIKEQDQHIVLFHYGTRVWNRGHHGSWLLFGHSHGELEPFGKSVDVGIDSPWVTGKREYRPFSYNEIKEFMDKQPTIKHHGD